MALPSFIPNVGEATRALILEKLGGLEAQYGVRILFAIESGSRAWGFPSPDSDYDVRFVYVHPVESYLTLTPGRDVIESPINDDLDIGGWDIRKALNLLLKPNPVMLEWLSSPLRYVWNDEISEKLIALAGKTAYATACLHHYLHLGETQWRQHVGGRTQVNLKKYFYVLRPALAIRWIRLNPDKAPPMNIQAMSSGLELDGATLNEIARLLVSKSKAKEVGDGDRIPQLDRLIEDEFAYARTTPKQRKRQGVLDEANELFRKIIAEAATP